MEKQHKRRVMSFGSPNFRRFVIHDVANGFWTGTTWSEEPRFALVFCRMPEAGEVLHKLDEVEMSKKPCKEFVAMVSIRVRGDEETINKMTLEDLQSYLGKSVEMQINFPGPNDKLNTNVSIDWNDLTPLN